MALREFDMKSPLEWDKNPWHGLPDTNLWSWTLSHIVHIEMPFQTLLHGGSCWSISIRSQNGVMCSTWCDDQGSACYGAAFHTEGRAMLGEGVVLRAASDGVEFAPFIIENFSISRHLIWGADQIPVWAVWTDQLSFLWPMAWFLMFTAWWLIRKAFPTMATRVSSLQKMLLLVFLHLPISAQCFSTLIAQQRHSQNAVQCFVSL